MKLNQVLEGSKANDFYKKISNNGDLYSEGNTKKQGYNWHSFCESGEYLVKSEKEDVVLKIKRIK